MSESRLCAKCQEIFLARLIEGKAQIKGEHHANSEAFIQAAAQGCYVCSWTLRTHTWSDSRGYRALKPIRNTTYVIDNRNTDLIMLYICVYIAERTLYYSGTFYLFGSNIASK